MSEFRFELNRKGVRQLLKSDEMRAGLKEVSGSIRQRLGDGYATDSKLMSTRAVASVYAKTPEARKDNQENNSILKALK